MSVDIGWEAITSGPDGEALAEKIRAFVHAKFQQITLPRFINSVQVHSFQFGSVCPEIEIKDICDPLPDFYEDEELSDEDEDEDEGETDSPNFRSGRDMMSTKISYPSPVGPPSHLLRTGDLISNTSAILAHHQFSDHEQRHAASRASHAASVDPFAGHFPRSGTPGIPGGTSNLSYFHLPVTGFSGAQTPLAAVASGTSFQHAPRHPDSQHLPHSHSASEMSFASSERILDNRRPSVWSNNRPSTANSINSPQSIGSPLNPSSPQTLPRSFSHTEKVSDDPDLDDIPSSPPVSRLHNVQPSDLQVVARVKYTGDIRMTLTAEILVDYPMPSFVGIPVKLNIVGMSFDGVAVLAYIKKKMHFCFLDPEDAETLVGDSLSSARRADGTKEPIKVAPGPLREIQVESEIGRKESGKQSLKNVGKVEKFVLEQVQRIFESEFIFPSFWTFLV